MPQAESASRDTPGNAPVGDDPLDAATQWWTTADWPSADVLPPYICGVDTEKRAQLEQMLSTGRSCLACVSVE
jgi:hypothetical protein